MWASAGPVAAGLKVVSGRVQNPDPTVWDQGGKSVKSHTHHICGKCTFFLIIHAFLIHTCVSVREAMDLRIAPSTCLLNCLDAQTYTSAGHGLPGSTVPPPLPAASASSAPCILSLFQSTSSPAFLFIVIGVDARWRSSQNTTVSTPLDIMSGNQNDP